MDLFSNILKNILVVIIVAILFCSAYFFVVLGGDDSKLPWRSEETQGGSGGVDKNRKVEDIVKNLERYLDDLDSVDINTDFFANPAFIRLEDFKQELPVLQQGRSNPFLPID